MSRLEREKENVVTADSVVRLVRLGLIGIAEGRDRSPGGFV